MLGSVGEPINPEAWKWYHEVVGDSRWVADRVGGYGFQCVLWIGSELGLDQP